MKIYQAIGALLNIRNTMWFQHDGYPAHNAISMQQVKLHAKTGESRKPIDVDVRQKVQLEPFVEGQHVLKGYKYIPGNVFLSRVQQMKY